MFLTSHSSHVQDGQKGRRYHPPTPELPLAALARWYVEALSHARTKLAGFFNILLETDVLLPGQLANPSVQFQ